MNEFIEQFLLESREPIEQATHDLLALEKTPTDNERLDSAFRAFHTLKGGAAIVDFLAMERAVHAAEDVLAGARSGSLILSVPIVGACFGCLDQVDQWLDAMEERGEVPADSAPAANAIVAGFAKLLADAGADQPALSPHDAAEPNWVGSLLDAREAARARAMTAIRYLPDADCFFRGEDPLKRIAALDGLLAVDLQPRQAWPALERMDPFNCELIVLALTSAPAAVMGAALAAVAAQCEIVDLVHLVDIVDLVDLADRPGAVVSGTDSPIPHSARAVLEAQLLLLNDGADAGSAGRVTSVGVVTVNLLRNLGRDADADRLLATGTGSSGFSSAALSTAIGDLLAESRQPAIEPAQQLAPTLSAARTLRVDSARVDALVSLTGELAVATNALGHTAKLAQETGNALSVSLKDHHAAFQRLVGELQRGALRMRVLPLQHVFQRFPRLLRDISINLGKPVRLVIEGEDTEADKAIVEMLFEPLLHVLRNAMDHGIESEDRRRASGKPAVATVTLRASRQGEHVLVEVQDDGAGVDVGKVREVALARAFVSTDVLTAMTDAQVVDLIFAPGFSTAEKVTDLSGRGVGMDAARTGVERLSGRTSVESRPGIGTMVRFVLPFTVMMTHIMTVEAGGQMYGIPFDAIVETVRVPATLIAAVGAAHAIVLRNQTVPVFELGNALGNPRREPRDGDATLVITRMAGQLGALRIDRVGERMEIMLKPFEGLLAGMPGIAGSALLGDGSVLLVLDPAELLQ